MARSLQKVIVYEVAGRPVFLTGLTVTIRDAANTGIILVTATYSAGAYTCNWTEISRFGIWAADGVLKPEWGKIWMGSENAINATFLFRKIQISPTPPNNWQNFVTGTAPLNIDIRGNAVPLFTQLPLVIIGGDYQDRKIVKNSIETILNGIVTIPLKLADYGADGTGGNNYFDLTLITRE